MKYLWKLNHYLFRYKWRLLLGTLFVIGSNYYGVLIPQKIRQAIDYVQEAIVNYKGEGATGSIADLDINGVLLEFALIIVGFVLIKGVFMYAMRQTIIVTSRLIEYDLRNDIFNHLEKLDIGFYKRNKTGDIMARISEDVNKVRMYLGPSLLYGINLTSLFILTITVMFKTNATLALYTLIPLPILSLSIYLVSSRINKKSTQIQEQLSTLNSTAQEVYSGIRVVKSYVKEGQFGKFFEEQNDEYMHQSLGLARINAFFFPLMILLISASTLLTIFVGGIQVANGQATPGNIAEFVIYVNMLTWPVTSIGWIASLIQQAEASQERIEHLFAQEPKIVNRGTITEDIKGGISFKEVEFIYPDNGIKALKKISFDLNPGDKMAIVGKTASGKSTIADLMLRLYEPSSGSITIDDILLEDHDLSHLRQKIAYVPQDVFLFSDTIKHNIAFGEESIDDEKVKEFASYASVHEDISGLPEGYETYIGERGVTLSGGQKQRVSIARALIKNPDIVILDDALSAVDMNTEQKILSYLNSVLAEKTSIIITHRIYNLINFDKIIFLEEGEIVESGTHNELIKMGGRYSELYEQQQAALGEMKERIV